MTFIGEFRDYMQTRTDAPPYFHLHGAMVALSAALGNRVWCDGWSRSIYPNLWVVNIAPSGYGKSTTLDMAQNLLQQAGIGDRILPGAFSQEALTRRLAERPNGVWFHQEFASFLGTLGRDYNCVDPETEILTRDGWKTHDQLIVGQDVLTLRRVGPTSILAWSPVKDLHRYELRDEPMLEFEGRTVSMLVTANHKLATRFTGLVRADHWHPRMELVQSGRWMGGYGRECTNKALAALIGWYVTEAWDDGDTIRIAQKSKIVELLSAMDGYRRPGKRRSQPNSDIREHRECRGMRCFVIEGETAKAIRYWAPNKQIRFDALWRWPKASLQALFETFIDGDGHRATRNKQCVGVLTQKDQGRIDFFQALSLRLGYRSTASKVPGHDWSAITVTDHRYAKLNKPSVTSYTGTVWCPTTTEGTWVARRHGRVFVTGNSGAMQWLTEIYDVPDEYPRILMKETFPLKRPCISILGASSPDWFAQAFHESSLRGGFLARFLFCPSATPGPYIGHPGPRDQGIEAGLAYHLREVGDMQGHADLSRVLPLFRAWDAQARLRLRDNCPPEFTGMRSRAGLLVLKAMMLFHVGKTTRDLVLDEQDFSNAVAYVEASQRQAEHYLDEEVAHDKKEQQRMRLREVLRRGGGRRTWSETLKLSKFDRFEFKSAVDTLSEAGLLDVEREGRTQWLVLHDAPIHHFAVKGRELANSGNTNGAGWLPDTG